MSQEKRLQELESSLLKLDANRVSMMREIQILREEVANEMESKRILLGRPAGKTDLTTNPDKIRLFLELFRARHEIVPKRWENTKTGKAGYSPVCANEWDKPLCNKPKVKCAVCTNQKFRPFDESVVEAHLKGLIAIGTYAIKPDDTCVFLACDFDKTSWQIDVATFRDTGRALGIDIAVERSRSGNGAHAWIFFEEAVPAKIARSLGTLILAKCSERNLRLSLESYVSTSSDTVAS